jgi:hypothetical protein
MLYQLGRLADRELTINKGLSLFSNIGRQALLLSGYRYAHEKTTAAGGVTPQPLIRLAFLHDRASVHLPLTRRPPAAVAGLFDRAAVFFAIALTGQRRFQSALFSGWNIEGVPLDFANNVFLLHLAFKPAESALQRLVIAEFDFCHLFFTCLSMRKIEHYARPSHE